MSICMYIRLKHKRQQNIFIYTVTYLLYVYALTLAIAWVDTLYNFTGRESNRVRESE